MPSTAGCNAGAGAVGFSPESEYVEERLVCEVEEADRPWRERGTGICGLRKEEVVGDGVAGGVEVEAREIERPCPEADAESDVGVDPSLRLNNFPKIF